MKSFLTIVDTVVGRRPAGHQEDYLKALEDAVSPAGGFTAPATDLRTYAPFRTPGERKLMTSRFRRLFHFVRSFRGIIRTRRPGAVLFPTPDFIDFVAYYLAAHVRVSRPRVTALFVLRRDAAGIVGNDGWKARLLEKIARRTCRAGTMHPVSDSRVALQEWQRITGVRGSLVTIPMRRRPPDMPVPGPADPVVFGLAGLFRPEKGAAHYDRIIEAIATLLTGNVRIEVQLPGPTEDHRYPEVARIRARWQAHPRVRLHTGHLHDDAYTRLICGIDILLLPYDVASYGTGTSGILHEVLALGGQVATTRFAWAVAEFDGHRNVHWLDDPADAAEPEILEELRRRAITERSVAGGETDANDFARSWANALRDADKGPVSALPGIE